MNIDYAVRASRLILATLAELAGPSLQQPPSKPVTPSGPTTGKPGRIYIYFTYASDPEGDQIFYKWEWGDDTTSDWLGPYDSNERARASHIWKEEGEYKVRVKAKDVYGAESNWSDPLKVSMPREIKLSTIFKFSLFLLNCNGRVEQDKRIFSSG
jgi:hypothetical protein